MKIGEPCPKCLRPITSRVLVEKRKKKIQIALDATTKRIANGNLPGPHQKYDHKKIIKLHKSGLSIRKIATRVGCSPSLVFHVIKKEGEA